VEHWAVKFIGHQINPFSRGKTSRLNLIAKEL